MAAKKYGAYALLNEHLLTYLIQTQIRAHTDTHTPMHHVLTMAKFTGEETLGEYVCVSECVCVCSFR